MPQILPVQEIRQLQALVENWRKSLSTLEGDRKGIDKKIHGIRCSIDRTEKRIKLLQESAEEPFISDHAVVRYLERVKGLDIEAIKKEMMPDKLRAMIDTLVSGKFPTEEFTAVVKDKLVITVVTPKNQTED